MISFLVLWLFFETSLSLFEIFLNKEGSGSRNLAKQINSNNGDSTMFCKMAKNDHNSTGKAPLYKQKEGGGERLLVVEDGNSEYGARFQLGSKIIGVPVGCRFEVGDFVYGCKKDTQEAYCCLLS